MSSEGAPPKADAGGGLKAALITLGSAFLGTLGGFASGGYVAYTEMVTAQEQFSIARAEMFKGLIQDLQDQNTARMALLNLWQLYPEKRDQKIIIAAAIETGQPDLVNTIVGFDEELQQVAEILHAKAVSSDAAVAQPALETLERVDPVRAAKILSDRVYKDIAINGDRYKEGNEIRDLVNLIRSSDKVAEMMKSMIASQSEPPVLMDYLLYAGGVESDFPRHMLAAYKERKNVQRFNNFLRIPNFQGDDARTIFDAVRSYVTAALTETGADKYELAGALVGLNNNSFSDLVRQESPENKTFKQNLYAAITDAKKPSIVRAKALILLSAMAKPEARRAVARVLADGIAGLPNGGEDKTFKDEIMRGLQGGLRDRTGADEQDMSTACGTIPVENCINQPAIWTSWLAGQAPQ